MQIPVGAITLALTVILQLTRAAPSATSNNNCSSVLAAVEGLGVPAKGEFVFSLITKNIKIAVLVYDYFYYIILTQPLGVNFVDSWN